MKFLRNILDQQKKLFEKGGKLEKFYPAFEAFDTFAFAPNHTAPVRGAQVRDAIDLKRMMMTVIIAMLPCLVFGIWNVGHQHLLYTGQSGDLLTKLIIGSKVVLPIVIVAYGVGLAIEFTFAIIKKHSVNEGYLVTGMLIPLVMPPTVPLWQVALGTAFAVVIGKEVFGGTGMNILNVAMTARAFLYFAYPTELSGSVWTYIGGAKTVEGYSGATALAIASETSKAGGSTSVVAAFGNTFSFENLFIGNVMGSIGETSTLMCLIGAAILIITGVGSWRIIVSGFAGAYLMGLLLNALAVNPFMALPAHYHLVMGGLAFGIVFMATDPVTASQTETGKWIYGFLIGVMTVLIRVFNPAYPEGIMLAVLLMNIFAPLIDFYVVDANKKRRLKRLKYATV
ncbi:MAG TPA: NADH:ubiquinone reductase (Na(+)-transporting) subunit B [Microscillaceae bacterium]|nr:NADH:ubiquinone reductase (Na(+)-transporting) subunit B [Microscillaceae bacterium]